MLRPLTYMDPSGFGVGSADVDLFSGLSIYRPYSVKLLNDFKPMNPTAYGSLGTVTKAVTLLQI